MEDETGLAVAIEDTRVRHQAVIDLILFTDQQAGSLLNVYLTVGIATATAGIAGLSSDVKVPGMVSVALLAAAAALFVGSLLCFVAMQSAKLNLPGRPARFWKWAVSNDVNLRTAVVAYLEQAEEGHDRNRAVNKRTARYHKWAKLAGAVTPAFAVIAAVLAKVLAIVPA